MDVPTTQTSDESQLIMAIPCTSTAPLGATSLPKKSASVKNLTRWCADPENLFSFNKEDNTVVCNLCGEQMYITRRAQMKKHYISHEKWKERYGQGKLAHSIAHRNWYDRIRADIGDSNIWMSCSVKTGNTVEVVVRKLERSGIGMRHGIPLEPIAKITSRNINLAIQAVLEKLWPIPTPVTRSKFLILVTTNEMHMVRAGEALCTIYPKLIHCHCLLQTCDHVEARIQTIFPLLNEFMANCHHVFTGAPHMVELYEDRMQGAHLPQYPRTYARGSWLKSAFFIERFHELLIPCISAIEEDTEPLLRLRERMQRARDFISSLAKVWRHFRAIADALQYLQREKLPLSDAVHAMKTVTDAAKLWTENIEPARERLEELISRNKGFMALNQMEGLSGNGNRTLPDRWTEQDAESATFAPLTLLHKT